MAIQSPLLETTIEGAKHILINFSGDMNLGLMETEEAAELIREAIDPEAEIIFGTTLNEELNDEVVVTVIATGLEDEAHTEAPARRSLRKPLLQEAKEQKEQKEKRNMLRKQRRLPKSLHRRTHVLPQEDSQIWIMIMNPKSRFPIF